jgi:hypothetical protein
MRDFEEAFATEGGRVGHNYSLLDACAVIDALGDDARCVCRNACFRQVLTCIVGRACWTGIAHCSSKSTAESFALQMRLDETGSGISRTDR